MVLKVVLWAALALFGFLWWKRSSANRKARNRS